MVATVVWRADAGVIGGLDGGNRAGRPADRSDSLPSPAGQKILTGHSRHRLPGDGLYPAQPDLYHLGTAVFVLFPRTAARLGASPGRAAETRSSIYSGDGPHPGAPALSISAAHKTWQGHAGDGR